MPQTRKALFVLPVDAPGGAERVIATAAVEMAKRGGWEITIVSLSRRLEASFLDQLGLDITVHYGEGNGAFPSEWAAMWRLPEGEFDLVFASHFRVNAALSMARNLGILKTKRFVTRESTVLADRSKGARLLAYRTLYRAYGAQDEIWAQTSYMAARVKDMLRPDALDKVRLIPNPVDVNAIRRRAAEPLPDPWRRRLQERRYIVWCGRLIDIKNPLLAIGTLRAIHDLGQADVGMLVIGAGPLEAAVREAAAEQGLSDALVFTGQQANPFSLMRACHAGLLTSRREGFPNVLLEMMSVGVGTIVTTDCAGDLAGLTGVQVVARPRSEDLATTICHHLGEAKTSVTAYESALLARSPAAFVDELLG